MEKRVLISSLPQKEQLFLEKLSNLLSITLPIVTIIERETIGIQVEKTNIRRKNHIVGLALSKLELSFVPEEIGNLSRLLTLSCPNNHIIELPKAIGRLNKLEVLNFNTNKLSVLPDNLMKLTRLRELDIRRNIFVDPPKILKKLKKLQAIDLTQNPFWLRRKEYNQRKEFQWFAKWLETLKDKGCSIKGFDLPTKSDTSKDSLAEPSSLTSEAHKKLSKSLPKTKKTPRAIPYREGYTPANSTGVQAVIETALTQTRERKLKKQNLEVDLFEGNIIKESELFIDDEKIMIDLVQSFQNALNLALKINYITKDTVIPLLQKTSSNVKSLALEANYITKDNASLMINKAVSQATALKVLISSDDEK